MGHLLGSAPALRGARITNSTGPGNLRLKIKTAPKNTPIRPSPASVTIVGTPERWQKFAEGAKRVTSDVEKQMEKGMTLSTISNFNYAVCFRNDEVAQSFVRDVTNRLPHVSRHYRFLEFLQAQLNTIDTKKLDASRIIFLKDKLERRKAWFEWS
jgi:hypothetical protein